MNAQLPTGLEEHPFSYRVAKTGEVRIERDGRVVVVVRGSAARRLAAQLGESEARDQLLLAKATGNYKRGNERRASRK